jgi:hypothetical protein
MRDLGNEIVLPAFQMDCRDWLVVTPTEAGLPDEVAGTPLLAMLSTVVLGPDTFLPASGLLSVGMVEEEDLECAQTVGGGSVAIELTDAEADDFGVRFLIPAPNRKLALLAEFSVPDGRVPELVDRIRALMRSFRWAA